MVVIMAAQVVTAVHAVTMSLANAWSTHMHSRILKDAVSVSASRNKGVHS